MRRIVIAAILPALFLQACRFSLFENPLAATPAPVGPTSTPYPVAQTTFVVTLPEALTQGETLMLSVMDEVTGLSWNATQYQMSALDSLTYTANIPVSYNSVIKYRYIRRGAAQVMEDTTLRTAVRYRLYHAAGPAEVRDIIADWGDKVFTRPTGTILGQVFNADTGSPLPNILVSAGGRQHITDSLGRFELIGLPTGTHNLVAYSMDGMYQPFQQGAVVEEGKPTIVDLRVKPSKLVNVTFLVSTPPDTVAGVPVRIAGNLLQFGNTFADLEGGVSTSADRMPIMSLQADGRYAITMGLPAGTYLQYKYTLGNGFWNAERKADGNWQVRELIVPEQDVTIQDQVATWFVDSDTGAILFEVAVPPATPAADIIYLQLNVVGWMDPLPMWPLGNNRWAYKLYSPLNFLGSFSYRYCRNGQCGSADDNQTAGMPPRGRPASTSLLGQDLKDTITAWKWFDDPEPPAIVGANINRRASGFVAGIEYQPTFRPNWSYYAPQAFANTRAIGANLAVLTPSWTYSSASPLQFETVPGQDPLWIDSAIMISQARALGLNVALFPSPHFPAAPDSATQPDTHFWLNTPRDAAWWQEWFTRYRAFAVNYADLAAQTGAQILILGGDWVSPALPGGMIVEGVPSNPPADADAQWRAIITDVRSRFKGQVFWAMPYTASTQEAPVGFLRDLDGIYLLWSAPLASNLTATKADYVNQAGVLLDNEISPLVSLIGKPLILSVSYPSALGAATGCVTNGAGGCFDFDALSRPNLENPAVTLNLQTQADLYEAMLNALNSRPWISGFVSRGYHLPAALQDPSTSIYSKPAADILWYWYPRLLGVVQ